MSATPTDDEKIAANVEMQRYLTCNIGVMAPLFMFIGFASLAGGKAREGGKAAGGYWVGMILFLIAAGCVAYVTVKINMERYKSLDNAVSK